jgi:cytochrome P450
MCQNPDIQCRVQEELDSVVTQDRLPQVRDSEDLPYLTAVVRETMRWKPSLPLSEQPDPPCDGTCANM